MCRTGHGCLVNGRLVVLDIEQGEEGRVGGVGCLKRVDEAEDFNELRKGAQAHSSPPSDSKTTHHSRATTESPPQSTAFPPQPSEIVEPMADGQ